MNAMRQDAWTEDEDAILAETVLRHIREGRTQLEAFKEVADQLTRTPAACGFRWNATIRKQYGGQIDRAKEMRKRGGGKDIYQESRHTHEASPIETAISLLEKMKITAAGNAQAETDKRIEDLKQENEQLKARLARYDAAWEEMGNLWKWVNEQSAE